MATPAQEQDPKPSGDRSESEVQPSSVIVTSLSDEKAQQGQQQHVEDSTTPSGSEDTTTAADDGDDDDDDFVPPPMATWQRRLAMLSLCLTLFLSALDITIISTALPTIARELSVSPQQYAWVGSGFTLASTASTPVWAKMSDVLGRKPVIMASAAVFMAGSLVCALADSGAALIGGRVVQGLGAGGSVVLVTIVIGDMFALADRAKYYGMTGIVWGVSSAVGPVLGGIFAQTIGWRWCFYINLPFDGVALIVLFFALKIEIQKEPILSGLRRLDWTGFVLIIGGTICFLYGLELGSSGTASWDSAQVLCLIVFGVVILLAFMLWESRFAKLPVIPGRIFHRTTNVAAFTLACIHAFAFISYDFFLPLYFQVVLRLSPLLSGVVLFALIIPLSTMPVVGGVLIRKTGNYMYIVYAGAALMTLGSGLFVSFSAQREWAKVVAFQVIAGTGAGLLFQSPMIALQSHLQQRDMAAAMSAYTFLRSLCSSVSIVIGTVLIQQSGKGTNLLASFHGGHGGGSKGETEEIGEGGMKGLRTMWAFYTAAAGLMLVAALFIKQKPLLKEDDEGATVESAPEGRTEEKQHRMRQTMQLHD